MTTIRDDIEAAFRIIEELGEGMSLTAAQAQDALASLIIMIDSWSLRDSLIYTESVESFTLTAGDGEYTIGSGGDFDTARPSTINTARIKDGSFYVQDLEIVGKDRYSEVDDGQSTGMPYLLWYDKNAPLGTIRLYPYPSTSYELQIYSNKPFLASSVALTDTLVLPAGYRRALRFNLAREIAPEYGKTLNPEAAKIARESKRFVMSSNMADDMAILRMNDMPIGDVVMNVETRK